MTTATIRSRRSVASWRASSQGGRADPHLVVGGVLTLLVIGVAVLGPLLAPWSPDEFVGASSAGPSSDHWLGTDLLGRDVFSRLLHGGMLLLVMSVAATIIGMVIGVLIGLRLAFASSAVDDVLTAALDIVLAFPQIVLALTFIAAFGPNPWLIMLLVAVSHVPRVARMTRAVALETVRSDYMQAAVAMGAPLRTRMVRESLPNLLSPLLVEGALRLTWSIALIASLGFLGLGIQPPSTDWGLMINENRNVLSVQPWAVLGPAAMIALYTVGVNMIAEGLDRNHRT